MSELLKMRIGKLNPDPQCALDFYLADKDDNFWESIDVVPPCFKCVPAIANFQAPHQPCTYFYQRISSDQVSIDEKCLRDGNGSPIKPFIPDSYTLKIEGGPTFEVEWIGDIPTEPTDGELQDDIAFHFDYLSFIAGQPNGGYAHSGEAEADGYSCSLPNAGGAIYCSRPNYSTAGPTKNYHAYLAYVNAYSKAASLASTVVPGMKSKTYKFTYLATNTVPWPHVTKPLEDFQPEEIEEIFNDYTVKGHFGIQTEVHDIGTILWQTQDFFVGFTSQGQPISSGTRKYTNIQDYTCEAGFVTSTGLFSALVNGGVAGEYFTTTDKSHACLTYWPSWATADYLGLQWGAQPVDGTTTRGIQGCATPDTLATLSDSDKKEQCPSCRTFTVGLGSRSYPSLGSSIVGPHIISSKADGNSYSSVVVDTFVEGQHAVTTREEVTVPYEGTLSSLEMGWDLGSRYIEDESFEGMPVLSDLSYAGGILGNWNEWPNKIRTGTTAFKDGVKHTYRARGVQNNSVNQITSFIKGEDNTYLENTAGEFNISGLSDSVRGNVPVFDVGQSELTIEYDQIPIKTIEYYIYQSFVTYLHGQGKRTIVQTVPLFRIVADTSQKVKCTFSLTGAQHFIPIKKGTLQ